MEKPSACLMCGGGIEQPATGRPRVYCGPTCRRAAEYELRRLQSRLAVAEKRAMLAGEVVATAYDAGERSAPRKGLNYWQAEVQRLQGRLLALLAGQPAGDSPPEDPGFS